MKKLFIISVIFVVLFGTYSFAWLKMYQKINEEIDRVYTQQYSEGELVWLGEKPRVFGYPFAPKVSYKKGFKYKNYFISIPEIIIKGFPIPKSDVSVYLSYGFIVENEKQSKLAKPDYAEMVFEIPKKFPKSSNKSDIDEWQKNIGNIVLKKLLFIDKHFRIGGTGTFGLNDDLQPSFDFTAKMVKYRGFINYLVYAGKIKRNARGIITAGLETLSKTDENGQSYVELKVTNRDRNLYIGPVKIIEFAEIKWPESGTSIAPYLRDKRSRPAPRQ